MTPQQRRRQLARYRLEGEGSEAALAAGLAEAAWFRSDVPRKRMKELMARSDRAAIRDTALWLGGMIVLGVVGSVLWLSWWCLPIFLAYGILYGSASDSRWHECGHGTAFKTRWMNQAVYQVACFCIMREPTLWRWQHTRHHTDTLIVGRDAEILAMRPARLARILLNFLGLPDGLEAFKLIFIHAAGRLTPAETTFVPGSEAHKIIRTSRVWLAIYAVTIIVAVLSGSWLPIVLVGGPRFYGCWLQLVYGVTQHAGMSENVLDHRLNTRSVKMCRINRFIYSNMNYHIEHHMFPMVPYHRLPDLHAEIGHDLPAPYPSIWAAYKEIVPAVLHQLKDPSYYIQRQLPEGAAPYHGPVPQPAPQPA